ncbi:very large low complexity protein [Ophiostoma piceae UAMH 11346]|uniref:ubiquitinyl hydrolase 1 n=1 Tax=Ophiostoma piceae (strain UAMH 11346) TaxID=1262450 RepID=S3BXI4_OPHP1|nr:very large low complexity protein [Ophiostoma piceae UAMH 11346]
MAAMTSENMDYMIHHVFLPPKLPGEGRDEEQKAKDHALVTRLGKALDDFQACLGPSEASSFVPVLAAVKNLATLLHPENPVLEETLKATLPLLSQEGGIMPVYLSAQNAGIIIRHEDGMVVFEASELVPPNDIVMSTQGRIKRVFPGTAVTVDDTVFANPEFIETLSQALGKLSMQDAVEMLGKAKKAGAEQVEDRDTTNPALVTKFLAAYIQAVGDECRPPRFWKNTREEVMWSNARLSWHRSPVWLLARVAMQTACMRTAPTTGSDVYKEVMIFFMSQVLLDAVQTPGLAVRDDDLHCMISKITRRIKKLADTYVKDRLSSCWWFPAVTRTLEKAETLLQQRWKSLEKASDPGIPMSALASLNFDGDTPGTLVDLDSYIDGILHPRAVESGAQFHPPRMIGELPANDLPSEVIPAGALGKSKNHELHCLAAFESWVEHHLPSWLRRSRRKPEVCGFLENLLYSYHKAASFHYGTNPENKSLMILTCLELWMACDKSATAVHPLLLKYDPGVPVRICQSLVLPLKSQMERLLLIEAYVEERVRQARLGNPNILFDFGSLDTFAVRYFSTSLHHHQLYNKIVQHATARKAAKLQEYDRVKEEHRALMAEYDRLECSNYIDSDGDERHRDPCLKCICKVRADALRIKVFEWPLPRNVHHAQATVFELDRPAAFGSWRDATLYLLMDVFRLEYIKPDKPDSHYEPASCLGEYQMTPPRRVRLLSETKPTTVTHRKDYPIEDATIGTVCVENGLNYLYYDQVASVFVKGQADTGKFSSRCVYTMPQSSSVLQQFLCRPHSQPNGPDPNVVISSQSSCPASMSLEEFKALASIPYGTRTQWSNLLVQLALPSIDFKKVETYLVILQTIHQAGPPCSSPMEPTSSRDGHQDLLDSDFRRKLVMCLRGALERIRENWESYQSLAGFIAIASRLVTMTGSDNSEGILESCRGIAMQWMLTLRGRVREATDSEQRTEFLGKAFEVALVGTSTFDADSLDLGRILESPAAAVALLRFYINIEETSQSGYDAGNSLLVMAHQRWVRLTSRSLPILLDLIVIRRSTCLSDAIGYVWADYQEGTPWCSCPGAEHWLTSQSHSQTSAGLQQQTVHFNLLTGELLVDGLPLSRLPATYQSQVPYGQLFSNATIEVMPTTRPGMKFSSIQTFAGYQAYFGIDEIGEMKLTCTKGGSAWDLIPRRVLRDMVPHHFLVDFTHWYHRNTNTVEFRPLEKPWVSSSSLWTLYKLLPIGNTAPRWKMKQDESFLVFSRDSRTACEMARVFSSVETIGHLYLIFAPKTHSLKVELPRLKIQFHIQRERSRLNSRECRGMYLDACTRIGTLVGLGSKLVLRSDSGKRVVLVPEGDVTWERENGHAAVSTTLGTCDKVHHYTIDDQLGRLLDNGSVQSKLYLCYLHALTSHCVPDRLINMTGTERALQILGETDIPSAARLTQENVDMLHNIAALSPQRRFYPKNMCVMQDVAWDQRLSFLSQHAELYFRSWALLEDAATREFFHHGKDALVGLDELSHSGANNPYLLKRDAIRASTFYQAGCGGELFTTEHDAIYTERMASGQQLDDRKRAACYATSNIVHGSNTLQHSHDPNLPNRLWNLFKGDEIIGWYSALTVPMGYDAEYLESSASKVARIWLLVHRMLQTQTASRFEFAMFIATLAFSKGVDSQMIQALCTMYTNNNARRVQLPSGFKFDLSQGREASRHAIDSIISSSAKPFSGSAESYLDKYSWETGKQANSRRRDLFDSRKRQAKNLFIANMMAQWPYPRPQAPHDETINSYFQVYDAMDGLCPRFISWWNNRDFYLYLESLSSTIALLPQHSSPPPIFGTSLPAEPAPRPRAYTTTDDLFMLRAPSADLPVPRTDATEEVDRDVQMETDNPALLGLNSLSGRLASMANQPFKAAYVADFRKSIDCIRTWSSNTANPPALRDEDHFRGVLAAAILHRNALYDSLVNSTMLALPMHQRYNAPRPSPLLFLAQLSHKAWSRLSLDWRKAIVAYGCAVTDVQRATRLVSACHNSEELARELANSGHTNWDPLDDPETLLQEVISGILTREIQIEIANMMARPPNKQNAAMQLNMGEGKSSVIVPIVAASLADGSRLVTVVVGKPQSKQMLQMLVSKLGGISGRRIYHMPFSRSLKLEETHFEVINRMCHECKDAGGIMLVQPEHLLSFQLAGPEMGIIGETTMSASALETHKFFNDYSRYVVDESDENFSVKFELIYTMGTQSSVELSPERWALVQAVLDIVQEVAPRVKEELPLSIDIEQGSAPGSFPRIRFLREDGRDLVCKMIAERVCQTGLQGLPIGRQSCAVRGAIQRYITEAQPSQDTITTVESCHSFWTEPVRLRLLLIRGLLGRGVLGFAFGSKRWRVNYGIDNTRSPPKRLAVPFRAKDSPAPQSEFSHPDVVIVLTCLSYYYGGLSHADLYASLESLALSDQASAEYGDWVRGASPDMSIAFHSMSGINLKDRYQCEEQIFPHLQRSKGAIDYFLSNIVFPKEMKEFPHKLSASGWDIGKEKTHPTTGFSGTSDSQHLLPLSVKHLDLPDQRHTNALVLQHLLLPKNTVVYMPVVVLPTLDISPATTASASPNAASDAGRLLRLIVDAKRPIQVILDAGAQILELTNIEMAKQWLLLDGRKEAVVYCGDNDEIMIIDRSGHTETLQASPFAQQLDRCLVFLDEAHARGIDLKLPHYYRAAVTLGANLTKDRLVQACMRMRELGQGQSVDFYVPKEIQDKIASVPGHCSAQGESCTVADVLTWAISETWADLSRSMPLWAVQGTRFVGQQQIWAEAYGRPDLAQEYASSFLEKETGLTKECASKFLEKEAMSLADHYKPKEAINAAVAEDMSTAEYLSAVFSGPEDAMVQSTQPELEQIVERCRQFDAHQHAGTSALHEEQERELSPEIENEKQVQRPHQLKPATHSLHPDIRRFVATGILPEPLMTVSEAPSFTATDQASHIPAFWSLAKTSAAEHLDVTQFPLDNCLYVSADFARTVEMPIGGIGNRSDSYLRPVQWVLTQRHGDDWGSIAKMMIISPYEAQALLPEIKKARSRVYLSLYAPRSNQDFAPIDHLQLHTVPKPNRYSTTPGLGAMAGFCHDAASSFSVQLNLFAGQLYFSSMAEYKSACGYLGLASEASTDDSTVVNADGFIIAGNNKSRAFKTSPAAFLGVYLPKIRWDCETISRTHWGKVLGGQFLVGSDFDAPEDGDTA